MLKYVKMMIIFRSKNFSTDLRKDSMNIIIAAVVLTKALFHFYSF